jgi:hypothetical protein
MDSTAAVSSTLMLGLQEEPQSTSTHVLVPPDQIVRLRELSKRTRVAQSEYLREAVDDLLRKYGISG